MNADGLGPTRTPAPLTRRDTLFIVGVTALICLPLGLGAGFMGGVAVTEFGRDMLEAAVTPEEPADVETPQSLAVGGFSVQYPDNWEIDEDSEIEDPPTYFTLDTPGSSYFQAYLYSYETDPQTNVDEQVATYSGLMKNAESQPFAQWGKYSGAGVHMRGSYIGSPSEIRIFSTSNASESFLIVEHFDTESATYVSPGYELIAKSFEYRPERDAADEAEMTDPGTAEELAATDQPHFLATEELRFEYPTNWNFDTYELDPHNFVSIDTPGGSYVSAWLFDSIDEPPDVADSLEHYKNMLEDKAEDEPIDTWGRYSGSGLRLRGKYEGQPVEVRVFSHASTTSSFKIVEFVYVVAEDKVRPGLDLVARTFEYRFPVAAEPETATREPVEAPRP